MAERPRRPPTRMSAECQLPPGEDHVPYLLLSLFQVVSLLRPPEEEASRAEEEAGFSTIIPIHM